ncbi:MAG: guanylate kinase [Panacagrimonas sp.]
MYEPHGNLFIVSAPSGGGKTSLTRALVPCLEKRGQRVTISISYTTRPPRPGEQHDVHYHFVDDSTFAAMVSANGFLEHAQVFGNRYGTGHARTLELLAQGVDVVLDIDWQGARQVRERLPDARSIFILPPSAAELERRLRGRGQDADSAITARMAAARSEMVHYAEYESLIVNHDFDQALEELAALFVAPRLDARAQARRHASLIRSLLE